MPDLNSLLTTTSISELYHIPQPVMPDESSNTCQALLQDGQTRCLVHLRSSTLVCAAHAPAYDASYQRYKAAEGKAARLSKFARMPPVDIQRLRSHEIERCQSRVRAYADALAEELRLRRKHDTQFIGTPDAGHSQRLEKLKRQIAYHRDILRVLRARRRWWQRTNTHTPVRRLRSPARAVSRIASPIPRLVKRRAGPKPEEERRASARAEARQRFEEARERQHVVVVEAEGERQQRAVDEEVFNNDHLEAALLLSRLEQKQYETDAHRVEGGGKDRMQEFSQIGEGCTQGEWVDEATVVTASSLPVKERLPEDSSKEAGGHIDTSGSCDDTASDSTSNASLDDLKFPIQESHEPLCIFIHVDDGCHLPNSMSSVTEADDTTPSAELSIKSEQGAGSEDSAITTFDSESAPSSERTWADNLHGSQLAVEAEEATVICVGDGSCGQVLLEEAQARRRAPSGQDCRDTVESGRLADRGGLGGGSNGRRPWDGEGWGRRYLRCLGPAVLHVITLLVIGRMYRTKSFGKLWKLFRRIAHVGARRILVLY